MLKLNTTNRFEKDYKKALKSGRDMKKLKYVMTLLAQEQPLAPKYRDHKLIGKPNALWPTSGLQEMAGIAR